MRYMVFFVTVQLRDIGAMTMDSARLHCLLTCFTRQEGEVYLYGIFDGHSGSKVAAFAAQRMPEEILLGQLHGRVTDGEIKDVLKQVLIL